jgi:hypothetical protein
LFLGPWWLRRWGARSQLARALNLQQQLEYLELVIVQSISICRILIIIPVLHAIKAGSLRIWKNNKSNFLMKHFNYGQILMIEKMYDS